MKTWRWFSRIFIFLCWWNVLGPSVVGADVYQGAVVDVETGEPLGDAALVVIWWTRPYVRMDGPRYFHEAKETLTDANGKFSLDVSPGIDWSPFTYIESRPNIIVYKPGYRPLIDATLSAMGFRKFTDLIDALKKGAIIKLSKLKTQEEAKKYISLSSLDADVPKEMIPNLVRLVNIQSKMAGIPPYPEPDRGVKTP